MPRISTSAPFSHATVRSVTYWSTTAVVAGELALGGIWDIARIPYVARIVAELGYPSYFLVLLGAWKVPGAVALLVPGRALLKEWAYAGSMFVYTGAVVSHLVTGSNRGEIGVLIPMIALTATSWALRPASRRTISPSTKEGPAQVPSDPPVMAG